MRKLNLTTKTIAFAKVMLVAVIFCGCRNENTTQAPIEKQTKNGRIIYDYGLNTKVRVFEVDSCEYIGFDAGTEAGTAIIHKQNCKFCAERSKK